MADIFISYSGEDKTNVKVIAELLEQQGWSDWWDRQIPIGQQYDTVIEEELAKADCVLVIWTKRSVASEWVKNEANEAAQLGKLVPVLLENVPLPLAFKRTETAMLTGWKGESDHPELSLLFNAISQTIEKNKSLLHYRKGCWIFICNSTYSGQCVFYLNKMSLFMCN